MKSLVAHSFISTFILASSLYSYAEPSPQLKDPILAKEWFALGSGCRAKFDLPEGNVRLERLGESSKYPGYQHLRFHIGSLTLDGQAQRVVGRDFGRECAVRLKAEPSRQERISDVIAETSLRFSKPKEMKLTLATSLKLGQAALREQIEIFDETKAMKDIGQDIQLRPDTQAQQILAPLKCGEPKIVGFDYTFIASTKDRPQPFYVGLDKQKILDVYVKLTNCSQSELHKA